MSDEQYGEDIVGAGLANNLKGQPRTQIQNPPLLFNPKSKIQNGSALPLFFFN